MATKTEFYRVWERAVEMLEQVENAAKKAFPDESEEISGSFEPLWEAQSHLEDVLYDLDQDGEISAHFRMYSDEPDDEE